MVERPAEARALSSGMRLDPSASRGLLPPSPSSLAHSFRYAFRVGSAGAGESFGELLDSALACELAASWCGHRLANDDEELIPGNLRAELDGGPLDVEVLLLALPLMLPNLPAMALTGARSERPGI